MTRKNDFERCFPAIPQGKTIAGTFRLRPVRKLGGVNDGLCQNPVTNNFLPLMGTLLCDFASLTHTTYAERQAIIQPQPPRLSVPVARGR